jgi:pyruvate dehydrogenase E1 component
MHEQNEDVFYYLTVGNETYVQPAMPDGAEGERVREGIIRGIYRLREAPPSLPANAPRVQLMGSGAILNEVVKGAELLAERYGVAAEVWSVTSWNELRREALDVEHWNMLHPAEEPRVPYVTQALGESAGVAVVAASDYVKAMPDALAKWLPGPLVALGTDGFGRSATREELRDFFEVDANHVALAALHALAREEALPASVAARAIEELRIDPEKPNPART